MRQKSKRKLFLTFLLRVLFNSLLCFNFLFTSGFSKLNHLSYFRMLRFSAGTSTHLNLFFLSRKQPFNQLLCHLYLMKIIPATGLGERVPQISATIDIYLSWYFRGDLVRCIGSVLRCRLHMVSYSPDTIVVVST